MTALVSMPRLHVAVALAVAALMGVAAGHGLRLPAAPADAVALVGTVPVTADAVAASTAPGRDAVHARDNAVQRQVLALAALERYPDESKRLAAVAVADAQAQLFLAQRTKELRDTVTPADVKAWYDSHVSASDFVRVQARYYLTQDAADADRAYADAKAGRLTRFAAVGNGKPLLLAQMPYGTGELLRDAKPGSVQAPLQVRDGYLVLYVVSREPGTVPPIEQLRERIVQTLALERLDADIAAHRAAIPIRLLQ